ncbi:MAG: hypothetical protein KF832_08570 [Caldilineaceae bacterium]|nr:hypothetical protein [Caldilineaceae bacterium]
MAKSNPELIQALRTTADRLSTGAPYEWGHMGRCNCGHLLQTITHLTPHEIVQTADYQLDEWTEHAKDYCEGTGHSLDTLFLTLQEMGFDYQDVIHLENLSDRRVLRRLGETPCYLRRNVSADVVLYMNTLAALLEEEAVIVR